MKMKLPILPCAEKLELVLSTAPFYLMQYNNSCIQFSSCHIQYVCCLCEYMPSDNVSCSIHNTLTRLCHTSEYQTALPNVNLYTRSSGVYCCTAQ